jgi:hypothetical protein
MLSRIRVLMDRLGDLSPQPRLLGKPLPSQPSNWMPADLDVAQLAADVGLSRRNDVRLLSEAD